MFDLTIRSSYDNAVKWFNEVTRVCPNIPSVLIGNKKDLPNRALTISDIELPRSISSMTYIETSVKEMW
jgi:GTP-binding nuclear protein Ran